MPRLLLALAVIVAIGAVSLGIRDYVRKKKEAEPPTSTSTPTGVHSNALTVPTKTTAANTRRSRMSATEADTSATALPVADDMEKPLSSEEFAKAGGKAINAIDNAPNNVRARAAHDELAAAMGRKNRVCDELNTITASETARPVVALQSLPLPNLTKPGDVDAAYYQNWAREYCEFIGVEVEHRRQ